MRQKQVFSTAQVCHVWASQSQESGRNPQKNVFFEGTDIYSYGSHYLMARIYPDKGSAVLINQNSYSSTTSGHRSHCSRAVSHLKLWYVLDPADPLKSIRNMGDSLTYSLLDMLSSRIHYHATCDDHFNDYNELCVTFGYPKECLTIPDDLKSVINDYMAKQAIKTETKRLEKKKERAAKLAARNLELKPNLEAWLKGANINHYELPDLEFQQLRVKGDVVETTGGADVPLAHALRLLALIDKKEAKGQRIGHFTVDHVSVGDLIITIGCHDIEIAHAKEVLNPFKGGL